MSFGGDFYALSDLQLEQLLEGSLGLSFLYNEDPEQPRECYADAEHAWLELMQLTTPEMSGYSEQTDAIPEMSQYSYSDDVKIIAQALADLDEDTVAERYEQIEAQEDLENIQIYIKDLTAFFQRAAQNNDAVLFRLT